MSAWCEVGKRWSAAKAEAWRPAERSWSVAGGAAAEPSPRRPTPQEHQCLLLMVQRHVVDWAEGGTSTGAGRGARRLTPTSVGGRATGEGWSGAHAYPCSSAAANGHRRSSSTRWQGLPAEEVELVQGLSGVVSGRSGEGLCFGLLSRRRVEDQTSRWSM